MVRLHHVRVPTHAMPELTLQSSEHLLSSSERTSRIFVDLFSDKPAGKAATVLDSKLPSVA